MYTWHSVCSVFNPSVQDVLNHPNTYLIISPKQEFVLAPGASGADTAQNLMGHGPRKIDWGGASSAGGSAPQAKNFLRIG